MKEINLYEATYTFDSALDEGKIKEVNEKLKNLVLQEGGDVLTLESIGRKKFAYKVKGQREGIYFLLSFKGSKEILTDLERNLRIQEEVLRYLIVKIKEKKTKVKAKEEKGGE